jgi:hypothetical protein
MSIVMRVEVTVQHDWRKQTLKAVRLFVTLGRAYVWSGGRLFWLIFNGKVVPFCQFSYAIALYFHKSSGNACPLPPVFYCSSHMASIPSHSHGTGVHGDTIRYWLVRVTAMATGQPIRARCQANLRAEPGGGLSLAIGRNGGN